MEKIDLNRMAELLNNFTLDNDSNTNSKNESEIESESFNYQTIKCDNMTLIVPDEILNNLYSQMDLEALEKKLEELNC
jgi:redox-regulated HSP33 family molecular chaperone